MLLYACLAFLLVCLCDAGHRSHSLELCGAAWLFAYVLEGPGGDHLQHVAAGGDSWRKSSSIGRRWWLAERMSLSWALWEAWACHAGYWHGSAPWDGRRLDAIFWLSAGGMRGCAAAAAGAM